MKIRYGLLLALGCCGIPGSGLDIVGPPRPCDVTITLYACDQFNAMDMGPVIYQETETVIAVSGRAACDDLLPEVLADFAKMEMGVDVGLKVCTANCAPIPSSPQKNLHLAQQGSETLAGDSCGSGVCTAGLDGCGGSGAGGDGLETVDTIVERFDEATRRATLAAAYRALMAQAIEAGQVADEEHQALREDPAGDWIREKAAHERAEQHAATAARLGFLARTVEDLSRPLPPAILGHLPDLSFL